MAIGENLDVNLTGIEERTRTVDECHHVPIRRKGWLDDGIGELGELNPLRAVGQA